MSQDETDIEEEAVDIDDPGLPDAIRQLGKQYSKPARWVVDLGGGEYLLYSEDYELLDGVWNCF